MNERAAMPSVDWEYETITQLGETHLQFQGQTPERELILANSGPPSGHDYAEWLKDFESGKLAEIPISIDTYFGPDFNPEDPDDEPEEIAHVIFIGHGRAMWEGSDLIVTLPPNVFRDAAASLLSSYGSDYADIELRIFHIFTLIDPDGFSRFLSRLETMEVSPSIDTSLIHHPPKATFSHPDLTTDEMVSVLRRMDGIISFQQLYTYIPTQDRTLRRWLGEAEMLDRGHTRLLGMLLTSDQILNGFVPWLRRNLRTEYARTFIRNLITAQLIAR